jgi:HK97 family phage portal protein
MSLREAFGRMLSLAPKQDLAPIVMPTLHNIIIDGSDNLSSSDIRTLSLFSVDTTAGVAVTEHTAMRVAAVYRCVAVIAGAIASMRLPIYRRTDALDGRERIAHDLWWLLNEQPHPRITAAAFWEFIVASMLLRGDGYALIRRNINGKPVALEPLRYNQVIVERLADGRLFYAVFDNGRSFGVEQDDMLHFPGFGFGLDADSCHGMSVIGWAARQAIGIAIQADRFAGQFYGSGAHPAHALKSTKKMSPELVEQLRNEYMSKYSGQGVTGVPMVLTEGLELAEISMNATDAQFLETRSFQRNDICIAFSVPPFMIGDTEKASSWGTGIEMMSLGFTKYTLQPHINRIEQELNRKLFRAASPFLEFDVDSLTRADSKTRAEVDRQQVGGSHGPGWKTINEIRAERNLPPITGGNELYNPTRTPSNASPQP